MPSSKCHFDGKIIKASELADLEDVAGEEVSWNAVENEKHERAWSRVIKGPNLSTCRVRGLERPPLELP
jgi:hypothetical protein